MQFINCLPVCHHHCLSRVVKPLIYLVAGGLPTADSPGWQLNDYSWICGSLFAHSAPGRRADGTDQLQYTPAFDDQHPGAASPYALRH
jgi:hypothetical protein